MRCLLLLAALLAHAAARCSNLKAVCRTTVAIPHAGVAVPFSAPATISVPLVLHFRCNRCRRATGSSRPLLIFMQAALARPQYYTNLARRLARFGFVVALPDYTARALFEVSPVLDSVRDFVQETIRQGFDCPVNGAFPTAELVNSVLKYFLSKRGPRKDVRSAVDLKKTIVFGHTFGGAISERLFNDVCEAVSEPVIPPPADLPFNVQLQERIVCEQYKPLSSPYVKIQGLITYEGFTENSRIPVPEGTFYVVIHSPFYQDEIDEFFTGKDFHGRGAIVQITNANHYAPGNFVTANENQRPPCVRVRPPPEDMFTTTREAQRAVIKSIATIIYNSFRVYVKGKGKRVLTSLPRRRGLLIANATII